MSEIPPAIHDLKTIVLNGETWRVDAISIEYPKLFTVHSMMDLETLFGALEARRLARSLPSDWKHTGAEIRQGTERMTLTLSTHRGPEWVTTKIFT